MVPGSWDDLHEFDWLAVSSSCTKRMIFLVFAGAICSNLLIKILVGQS